MNNIEAHLDRVFEQGAADLSKSIAGKTYKYKLDGMGYTVKREDHGKTGLCRVLYVSYSRSLDCDIYHLLDLETNQEFAVCQFEVKLEDT